MSGFINILIGILVFSIIIIVHEGGHFLFARIFKVKVFEFSVGMGPRILTHHGKNTDFSIKAIPFGGSCMMKGEIEDLEKNDDSASSKPDDDSFIAKPAWQRFLIVLGGPLFNIILAFLMSIILISNYGISKPVLSDVIDGLPAQEAGLQAGDIIKSINGHHINLFDEVRMYTSLYPGEDADIVYARNGQNYKTVIRPVYSSEYNAYMFGIQAKSVSDYPKNIFESLQYAYYNVRFNIRSALESIKYLFSGKSQGIKEMMGPVGIVEVIGDYVEESKTYGLKVVLLTIVDFLVLFSSNIGIMNLLPIPALDGGRLLLLFVEMITKKKLNQKLEGAITFAGFAFLIGLMFVVMGNDILRIIRG